MAYFIVFQNKTYDEESTGGYLWEFQSRKSDQEMFHESNLKKIQPGDYIFSVVQGQVVSMNRAEENCKEASSPFLSDQEEAEKKEGWMVKVNYQELKKPIELSTHRDQLLPLCHGKYMLFTEDVKGQQGYLFEINDTVGKFIKNIIKHQNTIDVHTFKYTEAKLKQEKDTSININEQPLKNRKGKVAVKPDFLSKVTNRLLRAGR